MTRETSPSPAADLATRLRAMAQGRDEVDVAQFEFIGLNDIRAAYGERWDGERARIQDVAEDFLRRRIHAEDVLIRGKDGFLVVFGGSAAVEAQGSAHQLAHGLNDFFLGETHGGSPGRPQLRFGVTSASMPVKDLAAQLADVSVIEPKGAEEMAALKPGDIEWRYQPVWDAKREILSNWYVAPCLKASGVRLPGYHFEASRPPASQLAAIDEASLKVAEQALHQLMAQGKQALVGVALHVGSLTNLTSRARLMAAMDRLDRSLMRYRVIKVAGIPPGFPRMYLNEIVGLLRARVHNVILGVAHDETDVPGLIASGPSGISVSLPDWVIGPKSTLPLDQLLKRLNDAKTAAHTAHMRFLVEGALEPSLLARLRLLGVDNLASTRVWPSCGEPDGMLRWQAGRLAA